MYNDKVLLCKRNIEPRFGFWTIPSGFMENGESVEDGAARECVEESGAIAAIGHLQTVYSLPQINQVYMIFLATVQNPSEIHSTHESSEVKFFSLNEIPWDDLAFVAVEFSLRRYIAERNKVVTNMGSLPPHYERIPLPKD